MRDAPKKPDAATTAAVEQRAAELYQRGQFAEAAEVVWEAIVYWDAVGEGEAAVHVAHLFRARADSFALGGRDEQAADAYRLARNRWDAVPGHAADAAVCERCRGCALARLRRYPEAVESLTLAFNRFRDDRLRDDLGAAQTEVEIAKCWYQQDWQRMDGPRRDVLPVLDRARPILHEHQVWAEVAELDQFCGWVLAERGQFDHAEAAFLRARSLYEMERLWLEVARIDVSRAKCLNLRRRWARTATPDQLLWAARGLDLIVPAVLAINAERFNFAEQSQRVDWLQNEVVPLLRIALSLAMAAINLPAASELIEVIKSTGQASVAGSTSAQVEDRGLASEILDVSVENVRSGRRRIRAGGAVCGGVVCPVVPAGMLVMPDGRVALQRYYPVAEELYKVPEPSSQLELRHSLIGAQPRADRPA